MSLCVFCGLAAYIPALTAAICLAAGYPGTCLALAFMGLALAGYGLWCDYLTCHEGY